MKKLILALIALAFAFAISSCCNQDHCPGNMQCDKRGRDRQEGPYPQQETPYRWDTPQGQNQPGQERQNRRW